MPSDTNNLVTLDDHRPHRADNALCLDCGKPWVAVAPVGAERLECPSCGTMSGRFWSEIPQDDVIRVINRLHKTLFSGPETDPDAWMQTYTGRVFYPLAPRIQDVCIEDIAHSLAYQCRYAGHARFHYSVAQHSEILSYAVPAEDALAALLHDASEAYLVDVPRPIKPHLRGYAEIERKVHAAICIALGAPLTIPPSVLDADLRIIHDERAVLMAEPPMPWNVPGEPLGVKIECMPPAQAEQLFLKRFEELTK